MLISYLILMLFLLIGLGFFTLLERKILGYMQIRKGPNKVGYMGLGQPFSDGMKLFLKEVNYPLFSNILMFLLIPMFSLIFCFLNWVLYLMVYDMFDFNLSILFFMIISSMSAYIILLSGWSSNSMYAIIGSYRGIAQFISYEIASGLVLLSMVMLVSSYNLWNFFEGKSYFLLMMSLFFLWLSIVLAEVNRSPYDFVEGESELVSGFNVEYSSGLFSLLFMAEYGNILFMSLISGYMFGGYEMWFIMMIFFSMIVIWVRGCFPRFRYDKLMDMAWKYYLSLSLGLFMFYSGLSSVVLENFC